MSGNATPEGANGKLVRIAVRSSKGGPMRELSRAEAAAGAGLLEDISVSPKRGITFLAQEQWEIVQQILHADIPWHSRRANVLTHGIDLSQLLGTRIRFGGVEVEVIKETSPCALMDQTHPGLMDALKPDCRAGVYGRVLKGGAFQRGDAIYVLARPGDGQDSLTAPVASGYEG